MSIIPTKFEVDMTIHCQVIAFLSADTSRDFVTVYAGPRFAYALCNFGGSTMKVIKVICENIARPCVKRRMSFRACAKSRDLLKVH